MPTLQWGLLLCDPTVVLIPHPPPTLCPVAVRTSLCLCGTGGAALSCSAACRTTTVGLGGGIDPTSVLHARRECNQRELMK